MRIAMALGLLGLLVACGASPPTPVTAPQAGLDNQAQPEPPKSEPSADQPPEQVPTIRVVKVDQHGTKTLEVDGAYVVAGMSFPETVAGFKRSTISEYKSRQWGRAIGYFHEADDTKVTVYVFGDGADLAGHYKGAKKAITDRGVGALLAEADHDLVVDGHPHRGKLAHYELQEGGGMTQSVLIVYSIRGFYLKYRVTTAPDTPLDEAALTELQEALRFPTKDEL